MHLNNKNTGLLCAYLFFMSPSSNFTAALNLYSTFIPLSNIQPFAFFLVFFKWEGE